METSGPEAPEELGPEGVRLGVADGESEHLALAVLAHPGRDDDRLGDDRGALVGLDVRRVEEDVWEADVVEPALAERADRRVELGADPGHLALADPGLESPLLGERSAS